MSRAFILELGLATIISTLAFGQSAIEEPPELGGEPKKVTEPSKADRELFEIIGHLKDEEQT